MIDTVRDPAWDRFVESHPRGWVCHLSGWKTVLEQAFPQIHGHFFAVSDNGVLRAALPVYEVSSWLLGKRLVSVPFATIFHPLFTDQEDLGILVTAVYKFGTARKVANIEIRATEPVENLRESGMFVSNRFKMHTVPLASPLEQILKKCDRTCVRQRLARAERSGVRQRAATEERDVREFYRLYLITRRRLGLPPHPYRFVLLLWKQFAPSGLLEIHLAEVEGVVVAGIMLLMFGDRVSAEYMVSDERYRWASPNHLLFWGAIQESKARGYAVFDFGRTDGRNTSLMDFKARWGAFVQDLPTYSSVPKDTEVLAAERDSHAITALKVVCRRAPLPALKRLGDFCYRHLG